MKAGNFHMFDHPYFISAALFVASFVMLNISGLYWPVDMIHLTSAPQGELLRWFAWVLATSGMFIFIIGVIAHDGSMSDEPSLSSTSHAVKKTVRRKRVS